MRYATINLYDEIFAGVAFTFGFILAAYLLWVIYQLGFEHGEEYAYLPQATVTAFKPRNVKPDEPA